MRSSRDRIPLVAGFLLFSLAAFPASSEITGTWVGTYQQVSACGGANLATSGSATFAASQTGDTFRGVLVVDAKIVDCAEVLPFLLPVPAYGTESGGNFDGVLVDPFSGELIPMHGTVGDSSMQLSFAAGGTSFTFTGTRTGSGPPESGLTGAYQGSYSVLDRLESDPCTNVSSLSYAGAMLATLTQSDADIFGPVVVLRTKDVDHQPGGSCVVIDGEDQQAILMARIDGTSLSGTLRTTDWIAPISGTVVGTTIAASGSQSGIDVTFQMTKTSSESPPTITAFSATPETITIGQASTLSWATLNAVVASIDNGIGTRAPSGSVTVAPAATTVYALTATNTAGSASATATVTVSTSLPPASIEASSLPTGMIQLTGSSGATDRYTLTNSGGTATAITLSQIGTFFTQSPTSFTLAPGQSQTVVLTATLQPSGVYDGSSVPAGTGVPAALTVPVRLLVTDPPASPVKARPAVARAETAAPASQNPSGSISFTNSGTGTLRGIASSDSPWIRPQQQLVTIGPGESALVGFSIDRSMRPDSAGLVGAAAGSLSLAFPAAASGKTAVPTGAGTSSVVSVPLVDVVTPGLASGVPPPLGGGVAFFIPGVTSKGGKAADVVFSPREMPIGDLKIFFSPAGGSSQVASVPQLAGNASVAYPGICSNVFGQASRTGTLQIRSSQIQGVAVSASLLDQSKPGAVYATALPIFRSDRGAAGNESLYLLGLEKTAASRTDLYVQEVAGVQATVRTDFLGPTGAVISSRAADPITGFGLLELADAVPSGAVMARVTNTSSGSAKVAAYASVVDGSTGDAWMITDLAGSGTDSFVCPVPQLADGSASTHLYLTNVTTSAVAVQIESLSRASRKRAVRGASHSATVMTNESHWTIGALGYLEHPVTDAGFLRITAPRGAIRASARSIAAASSGGSFGSGVPVVPPASGLPLNGVKRFCGVEDSSSATVGRATPATYRSDLLLVETAGQPATVRLTLSYLFTAGLTTAAVSTATRDVDVPAFRMVYLSELARSIIGSQREKFGDLHHMTLDVRVIEGTGMVLPFLQSTDNGSGDVTIRGD